MNATAIRIAKTVWTSLGGSESAVSALSFTGNGDLLSAFAVTDLASAAIGLANLSIAELISQASSEHTICFAVRGADAKRAIAAIEQEFRHEVDDKLMIVDHKPDQAILAVVGEGMKGFR